MIKKLTNFLVKFGIDFYLHILGVMIIAGIFGQLCNLLGATRPLAGCIGVALGLVAGFFKEFYDAKTTKIIDPKDYVADLIGAILFFLIFI